MHLVRVAGLAHQQKKLPSEIEAEDNRNIEALEIVINTIRVKERSQQNHG